MGLMLQCMRFTFKVTGLVTPEIVRLPFTTAVASPLEGSPLMVTFEDL